MWWTVLYLAIWPMRLLCWELPKLAWRGYQAWQTRRPTASAPPPPVTPPTS
ncbi:hypothetical protein [Actinacidiphila epipremni]|uniref:DUF418 domain-containing protein n=1 Tax=Actinacidiphila epipremni TaxID=2053013 RepID=A0ABX0ZJI3_9ACTN|nr:hypothetical protein [Actinacidiphila epipremni]NJP42911.1 hypothetical protein [Actinacidiphila epipremni]